MINYYRKIISVLVVLVIFILPYINTPTVQAAILIDSSSSANTGSATASSLTWAHAVSGSDRILIVGISINGNVTVSTVTYRGQSLTRLATVNQGTSARASLWYLLNPPTGSGNVIVTMSAVARVVAGATSYTGVNQVNPIGTPVTNGNTGTTASLNVTSTTNELMVDVIARRGDLTNNPITSGSGQTQRWNTKTTINNANTGITGGSSSKSGATTVTMTWTWPTSRAWAMAGISLKPVIPPSDITPPLRFNGVPSGTLPPNTTQTTISLSTDENATCRWSSTAGTAYSSMSNTFSTTGGMNHSQSVSGLSNGSTYNYYIRCQDLVGNSNNDDFLINFSIDTPPPPPDTEPPTIPTNLLATASTYSRIGLSWDPSTDNVEVAGYKVFRDDVLIATVTDNSYPDSGLSELTTYTYQVLAFDTVDNESQKSQSTNETTPAIPVEPDTEPPSTPSNLSAIAISTTEIDLTWDSSTDNTSVAAYRVYRDGTHVATIINNSYSDTGLVDQTTYIYRVSAFDTSNNESSQSSQVSATTFSLPPPPDNTPPLRFNSLPSDILPSETTQATISLSTDENSTCRYSTLPNISYASMDNTFDTTGSTQHSQEISNLTATSYNFYIRCIDSSGNVNEDDLLISFSIAEVVDTTPPTQPANLRLISVSSDQVDLAWDASIDNIAVVGYKVFRDGVQVASTNETDYSGVGVVSGTTYQYTISAYDSAGNESLVSDPLVVTTLSIDTTAPSISDILVANITTSSALISWNTDELSISEVQYGLTTEYGFTTPAGGLNTNHSFTLQNLAPNATYHYRVSSRDATGNETISFNNTFQTINALDLIPPNKVFDLAIGLITDFAIDLSWTTPSDDTGAQILSYDLRYSTSLITEANWSSALIASGEPFPNVPGENGTYTVVNLTPNTTYYFAIKSSDTSGNISQLSNIASGKTSGSITTSGRILNNLFPPPSDFKALSGDRQIQLQWKNPVDSNFVRVIIQKKVGNQPTSRDDGVRVYEGTKEEYTDTNLDNKLTYYYAIYAFDRNSNYSGPVIVSAQPQLGIASHQLKITEQTLPGKAEKAVAYFQVNLLLGASGEEVRKLQLYLAKDSALYPEGLVSGYFGNLTRRAVQRFQCKYKIACSDKDAGFGIFGPKTREKINSLLVLEVQNTSNSESFFMFTQNLYFGVRKDEVKYLQEFLGKDRTIYPENLVTGYFGILTKTAVQRFQCKYNIVCSGDETTTGYGRVGPKTREKINDINLET